MEKEVKEMKKVAYLVSKVNKDEKFKGVGYLFGADLLIAATSSKGNLYIKTIPNVTDYCKSVDENNLEFKGYVTLAYTDVHVYNKEKDRYDTLDYVETTYYVWYKFLK